MPKGEPNSVVYCFHLITKMEAVLDVEALRANLRADGRKKNEMRSLHMEKESTYRADGSATVSQGLRYEQLIMTL